MPNRILREGINSSARVNALSLGAEVMYRRLISVADDYGRYYASLAAVRGACWPTFPEKVSEEDVAGWIEECTRGDRPLLILYQAEGCRYLQLADFGQRVRAKSKFPDPVPVPVQKPAENPPQSADNCPQPADNPPRNASTSRSRYSLFEVGVEDEREAADAAEPVSAVSLDPLEYQIQRIARSLYARHPAHRRKSIFAIAAKLREIARLIPLPEARAEKMELIDANHIAWVESEWRRDGGRYAPAIDNWLKPLDRLYEELPPARAREPTAPDKIEAQRQTLLSGLAMVRAMEKQKCNVN